MKSSFLLMLGSIYILIFSNLSHHTILAQETPVNEGSNFKFSIDFCRFRHSDTLVYFEFYVSFYRNVLKYIPEGNHFKGEFLVTAQVLSEDSLIATKTWKNLNIADSLSEIIAGQRLFCLNDFVLASGKYNMKVKIEDPNQTTNVGEYSFPITISGFSNTELQMSDIQLSSMIVRDTTKSYMVKNGYRVTPNPTGVYGIVMPMLYMYSEIYNFTSASRDSGGMYRVTYKIFDADGKPVKTIDPRVRRKPGFSAVEVNGINVVTLVSGAYYILLEVVDLENNHSSKASRKFFVYREADYAEGGAVFQQKTEIKGLGSPGVDADRYDIMNPKELDEEFEYTRYISSKEERDTYKKLNEAGKRSYLKEFWAKRDQTLGTPENEYKRDYLSRVEYANQTFKGGFRNGWRTDRGRILLVYGRSDEIERFPFSNQNRTYEIWNYFSLQGGIQFFFVDKRDTGDLELVHSTARGELYDPEWQRWIDPNR